MEIDYSYTQLNNDELAELLERRRQEENLATAKDQARWQKARSFRFQGGMC
jgi:hypothetical protein